MTTQVNSTRFKKMSPTQPVNIVHLLPTIALHSLNETSQNKFFHIIFGHL